jgi:hypothetical protein
MDPKIVTALLGYTPNQVPVRVEDIPAFLADELERIAFPLQVLANTWEPAISAGLTNPAQPTTVLTTPTAIKAYQAERVSRYAPYLKMVVDKAVGTIGLGGQATSRYTLQIVAFFTLNVGTLAQNQEVFAHVTDGVNTWSMGSAYISEPQQKFVSMGSVRLVDVPANSTMQCYLQADTSAGTVEMAGGEFSIQVLDSYEPDPVA